MFCKLPAETYLEIQESSKKKTAFLLVSLFIVYTIAFYGLLKISAFFAPNLIKKSVNIAPPIELAIITLISLLSTYLHYSKITNDIIPKLPGIFGASLATSQDTYHNRFINIVHELSQATGLYGVRPAVLSSMSTNAFALSNGKDFNYVIITEGLLARLNRAELEGVIAHEFSHILHGDAMLTTLSCSLFGIFEQILQSIQNEKIGVFVFRIAIRHSPFFIIYLAILKIICSVAIMLSRIIVIFISRQRETLADATAVKLTRNPLAIAEALYKISQKWKGGGFVAKGFAPLFILNPYHTPLDEQENPISNLFSTHPPLRVRLQTLLNLAKDTMDALQRKKGPDYKVVDKIQKWWVYDKNSWTGPFTMGQLTAITNFIPLTWICKDGTKEVKRAKEEPSLSSTFNDKIDNRQMKECPRCNKALIKRMYEGTSIMFCMHCKGHLVDEKSFIKILARHDEPVYKDILEEAKKLGNRVIEGKKPKDLDGFPAIKCPRCKRPMSKVFHSYSTFIVLDKCRACKLIWFDEKELEYINSLAAAD